MICGIDIGQTGAIAYLGDELIIYDIPVLNGRLDPQVIQYLDGPASLYVLEDVHAWSGQGATSSGGFMLMSGLLEGILWGLGEKVVRVTPQKWKRRLGISGGKTKTERKNKSLALARQLWPDCGYFTLQRHHDRAEAALLAYYGQLL